MGSMVAKWQQSHECHACTQNFPLACQVPTLRASAQGNIKRDPDGYLDEFRLQVSKSAARTWVPVLHGCDVRSTLVLQQQRRR